MASPSASAHASSARSAESADIAFNAKLVGCILGSESNRTEKLVIRVSTEKHPSGLRNPAENLAVLGNDRSGAGLNWSREELSTQGYPVSHRVVVVGILVLNYEKLDPKNVKKKPSSVERFLADRHASINVAEADARLVICKIGEPKLNMFALADKDPHTGLCKLMLLPQVQTWMEKLFFFREWTGKNNSRGNRPGAQGRHIEWKSNVRNFVNDYVQKQGNDSNDASGLGFISTEKSENDGTKSAADKVRLLFLGCDALEYQAAKEIAEACKVCDLAITRQN